MTFTEDQKNAYRKLTNGENVFLTGEAGTGKTFVLDLFLKHCEEEKKNVLAMAPTGIAALNLRGGSTIHRTLGIPPKFCDPNEKLGKARDVLKEADIIVIDEISMVRIDLFERVAKMITLAERASRKKQVVLVGDFFQLPPVVSQNDEEAMASLYPGNINGYCFKSNYWTNLNLSTCILSEVVRQRDEKYIEALNQARRGDRTCIDFFNQNAVRERDDAPKDSLWLCTTNKNANNINEERLDELRARPITFVAKKSGLVNSGDMPTNEELTLKIGCRVMSVANDPMGQYQNGSLGVVTGFSNHDKSVIVAFDNGYEAEISAKEWQILKAHVVEKKDTESGENVKRIENEEIGSFTQIPLRLAWAVTIHKSQGQTFDAVNCETSVFQAGMLYVALSRCSNLENLCVYPKIDARHLYAQEEVVDFYDTASGEKKTETISIERDNVYQCADCETVSVIISDKQVCYCPHCGKRL